MAVDVDGAAVHFNDVSRDGFGDVAHVEAVADEQVPHLPVLEVRDLLLLVKFRIVQVTVLVVTDAFVVLRGIKGFS